MPRMEVSSSMQLSDVQNDNYWRDRYRHDGIRDKQWQDKTKSRRTSSFKVMPVAPQLRSVDKSTSQSQLAVGGRRSSYEWSVPAKRQSKSQSLPNLLKTPPPLKQTKRQYIAPQQRGRYSLSPIPSRPESSMSSSPASRYLVPEVCSTNPSSVASPTTSRKWSMVQRSSADGRGKAGGKAPERSPGSTKRSFVPNMTSIGRHSSRAPFRR